MTTPKNESKELSLHAKELSLPVFDIDNIISVEVAEVQLKRKGAPLPLWVSFMSPEHGKRKQLIHSRYREARNKMKETGSVAFTDPAEDRDLENEMLMVSMTGWRGFIAGGKEFEFTQPNIYSVLNDKERHWLRVAILEAFNDLEAFIVTSKQD
jgi:hypothetical protein